MATLRLSRDRRSIIIYLITCWVIFACFFAWSIYEDSHDRAFGELLFTGNLPDNSYAIYTVNSDGSNLVAVADGGQYLVNSKLPHQSYGQWLREVIDDYQPFLFIPIV
jgi:hypothetical protein